LKSIVFWATTPYSAEGRRPTEQQADLWVATSDLPKSPGHVFYDKLNQLLQESGFDSFVEKHCQKYYADGTGRESIPPGIYFRMLLIGYFEGSIPNEPSPGDVPIVFPCGLFSVFRWPKRPRIIPA
jgi:hypothetical protein